LAEAGGGGRLFDRELLRLLILDASLYTLLQILSVTLFEKMPLQHAFPGSDASSNSTIVSNQLNLFAF